MAKKTKPTSKPAPNPYSLGSIWTGPKSEDPGVLLAQKNKAKRDSVAKAYSASSATRKKKSTK